MLDEKSDAEFLRSVTSHIEGWLFEPADQITQCLLRKQETDGSKAPLLEIGVFAGKYLSLLIAAAERTGSKVVGIDTFEYKPIEVVRETISRLMPGLAADITLHKTSSAVLSDDDLLKLLESKPRFISIDGSHEYMDVIHDLVICNEILDDTGIIAVDDFINPRTLDVNRAVNYFMEQIGPKNRLNPLEGFSYVSNKLFLARPKAAKGFREFVEATFTRDKESAAGKYFNEQKATGRVLIEQPFFGASVIVHAR
jgi:hypothetical protein